MTGGTSNLGANLLNRLQVLYGSDEKEVVAMRSKIYLLIIFIAAIMVLGIGVLTVEAATCFGSGCNGLNPNSTGCDSTAIRLYSTTSNGAFIELRKSTECSTFWARTTNVSGINRYANATLKYYYYTASPAPIGNGEKVYSAQRYSADGAGMYACGMVSNSPINSMVYSPCVP